MDPATPSSTTAATTTPPAPPRTSATEQRIAAAVGKEPVIAWARAWVSHETRLPAFAARTLDYVVLTDRSLYLLSTGFFSRRPRRPVFAASLQSIVVQKPPHTRGYRLAVTAVPQRTLVLELRRKPDPERLIRAFFGDTPEADTL